MRSFAEIFADHDTDKQWRHQYGEVYDTLLARHRGSARKVLELGVDKGGSLLAWLEAFPAAEVCGVDIERSSVAAPRLTVLRAEAYVPSFVSSLPGGWDVIVDDGPHTLESMQFVAAHYAPKLAPHGTLVIEDVQAAMWGAQIAAVMEPRFRQYAFGVDRTFVGAGESVVKREKGSRLFVVDLGEGS